MNHYLHLRDVPVYVTPDNGRFQPKLTLADVRAFLVHPDRTHTDSDEYGWCPTCWGKDRFREVLRANVL